MEVAIGLLALLALLVTVHGQVFDQVADVPEEFANVVDEVMSCICDTDEYIVDTDECCLPCDFPNTDEYVIKTCDDTHNTVIASCSQPIYESPHRQYVVEKCDPGIAFGANKRTGTDTQFEVCSNPADGYYTSEGGVCQPGNSDETGQNTATEACTEPLADFSQFVMFACDSGRHNREGGDTRILSCATPTETGVFVEQPCVIGSSTSSGSNTVIEQCKQTVAEGSYFEAACVVGSVTEAGSQSVIQKCDPDPSLDDDLDTTLKFVNSECVAGTWLAPGSNTVIEQCATHNTCPSSGIGADSCAEMCGKSSIYVILGFVLASAIAGLCTVWCVYVWISSTQAQKPIVIESATKPGEYVVCLHGNDVHGKLKRGIFVLKYEEADNISYIVDKNKQIRENALFQRYHMGYRISGSNLYWGHYEYSMITVEPINEMLNFEEVPALNGQEGAISFKYSEFDEAFYLTSVGSDEDGGQGMLELRKESDDEEFLDNSAWFVREWQNGSGFEYYSPNDEDKDDEEDGILV